MTHRSHDAAGRILVAVLCACVLLLEAATPAGAAWQNFKSASGGLLNNQVLDIAEDADGAMWFGTQDGASRFDGVRWSSVVDSLPNTVVNALLQDHSGRLWFGTNQGGLAMFDGARWRRFGLANGTLPSDYVLAIVEDLRGDLWFGTDNGLTRYEPTANRWTTYPAQAGGLIDQHAWRLLEDRRQRLWIATPHGVSMLDPTRTLWSTYRADPNALGRDSVLSLCEDAKGGIWFGTDQGAWSLGDAAWRHWTSADGLPGDLITAMARDSSGRIWFGGLAGVSHSDGVSFRRDVVTSDGQAIGPVRALRTDASGNIWIGGLSNQYLGATSQGVFRFDGVVWRNYFAAADPECAGHVSPNIPSETRLPSNCLTGQLLDSLGDLWFGTYAKGVARLSPGGAWSLLQRAPGFLLSDSVSAMVEDQQRSVWFGSLGHGLAALDSTRTQWTLSTAATGLTSDDIRQLFVDRRGDLWVGTVAGANRRTSGGWSPFLQSGTVEIQQFAEAPNGELWLRTSAGLYSIDAARASSRLWTAADGLADDFVTAMYAARDGSLWFGTARGVSRLNSGIWKTWRGFGVAGDSSVSVIGEDATGAIWIGTDIDAARWDGANWRAFTGLELGSLPVTSVFGDRSGTAWLSTFRGESRWNGRSWRVIDSRGNGLASDQVDGVLEDGLGRMWLRSWGGLAEHEPDRVAPQTVFVNLPPVLSSSRSASFVYGAAYGEVADLEYEYSWDGGPYSAWSSDNTFNLAGVVDGTHTFLVRARDWVGNVDPTPAHFTFDVDATPPPALIASPAFGQPVRGRVTISGTAADSRFHDFAVQARPVGTSTWTDPRVQTLASSTTQASNTVLATWDTSPLPDGDYEVRLAVTDTLGLVGIATIRVIVDNVAPFANVTSPVRLVARDGGDIFTTNAEVHVYFPPNAFEADPLVSVDSTASAAYTLSDGSVRRSAAWSIGWTGATLAKPGVLQMRPNATGGALTIRRDDGAAGWTRLGGTAQDGGALALTLAGAGRYALFTELKPPTDRGGLSVLSLTPRALSATRQFGSGEISIGFSLARSSSVTVKLYNRAGRLVRTVAQGMSASPGANLVRWDGRGDDGHAVGEGLYFVTVEALGESRTRTLAVTR